MAAVKDAKISALQPPPIDNLGNSSSFSFRLQDRGQRSYAELMKAKDQLIEAARRSPVMHEVFVEGPSPPAPQVELMVDREKAMRCHRQHTTGLEAEWMKPITPASCRASSPASPPSCP
jgi:multidrug efflux pump subunit AcrB